MPPKVAQSRYATGRSPAWGRSVADSDKSKTQLLRELESLRRRVVRLEVEQADSPVPPSDAGGPPAEETSESRDDEPDTRRESEQTIQRQYQALLDAMPGLLFRLDDGGTFLEFMPSPEIEPFMPPPEFLGRRLEDVLPPDAAATCMNGLRRALETRRPQVCEYRLERDGQVHDYEARIVVTGEREVLAIVRDFTERRRAEEQLRFQAKLLDGVRESVIATDLEGLVTYWGHGAEMLYGYKAAEVLGKHITMIVSPEEAPEEVKRMEQVLEVGSWKGRYRQRRKDGSYFWADTALSLVTDRSGQPCGFIGIDRDITDRKEAEDGLREAEQRYRTLFNQSPEAIVIVDPTTMLPLEFNDVALRMLGYTAEEFARIPFSEHEVMESPEEIKAHIERIVREGVDEFDTKLRTRDGRVKEVLSDVQAVELSGRVVFHTVLRDITERSMAERSLRESEERFRGAFEHTAVGKALLHLDGRFMRVNNALCRMLGYTADELLGQTVQSMTHTDDLARSLAAIEKVISGELPVFTLDKRYLHKDGRVIWGLTTVTPARNVDGEPLYLIVETQDITDRKHAQQALRRSEEHLRLALRAARVGAWEWNIRTSEVHWSEGVEEIFGLTVGSFGGSYRAYLDLIFDEDRPVVQERISRAIELDEPYSVEHRIVWPDGSVRWLAGDGRVFKDEAGNAVRMAGTVVDITGRKTAEANALRLQGELAHVARVSTMGELAAGLAHELNQPLTVICGYAADGARRITEEGIDARELVEPLEAIAREAERTGEIIRRLWNLICKGEPRRSTVHINDVIREVSALIRSEARHQGVAIEFVLGESLPPVVADSIQIQQVLLNVVRNACDAMEAVDRAERRIVIQSSAPEPDLVCVAVRDVGRGITPETLDRIFEPFFTDKPDGLGMGLTISRSIVDAHGGHLSARPNVERGTIVEITLPAEKGDG